MRTVVKKWSNSASVRITAAVIQAAHLDLDEAVIVRSYGPCASYAGDIVSISCVFRGRVVAGPKSSRSAVRNDAGHDSGMMPVTDSDFKPVTFCRWSES